MGTRSFRFGIQASGGGMSRDDWIALGRRAEDLGYSTLTMPDHFGDQLAPLVALQAIADATTTLRVGTLVLDNDYRHPVVLAKEVATLDVLSGGRVELGLGAGWMRTDYEQSGIAYDPPKVRVDRFEEGLEVLTRLLAADGPVDFSGEHYTIAGLEGHPRPVQSRVPILIGGGAKRVLSIAARHADIVGINFDLRSGGISAEMTASGTAEMVDEKIGWIRDAAGDRFDELELNIDVFVASVTDDRGALAEALAAGFGLTAEQALEIPFALVGTIEQMIETLQQRRERYGISYVIFPGDQMDAMAPVVAALAGT